MTAIVYVLSVNGNPLMPTHRGGHVRLLLKSHKARVISKFPFTIKLLYNTPEVTQPLYLGIDPGRTNIGLCVTNNCAEPVFSAQVETRNKDIPKNMMKRKANRQKHRNCKRRQSRRRRARKNNTTTQDVIKRRLPQCNEDIVYHDIKNKESRFCNRRRNAGWLTPTANQLLQTHINAVKTIAKFLPITDIVIEANRFAFMLMDNPLTRGKEFCEGPLKGFDSVEDAIYHLQKGKCLFCSNDIRHYHHVIPKHCGGSETIANRVGLCNYHHDLVHTNYDWQERLLSKVLGIKKKYAALGVLNQIFPQLIEQLFGVYPKHVIITDGRTTANYREDNTIPKDHHLDAYCMVCSQLQPKIIIIPNFYYQIKQYRRHDRMACKQEMLDRKYYLDGKFIAANRHKAYEQKTMSLDEYVANSGTTANLTVPSHKPTYQRQDRIMPGAVFMVGGERMVLHASRGLHNGKPDYYCFEDGTSATPRKSKLILKNMGLVFVSKILIL